MQSIGWQEITGVVSLAGFVIWLMSKFITKIYNDQKSLSFEMTKMLDHNAKMLEYDAELRKNMISALAGVVESIKAHSSKIEKVDNTVDNFSKILMEMLTKKRK